MYIHIQSMVSLIDEYRTQMTYPNNVWMVTNARRRVSVPAFTKHKASQLLDTQPLLLTTKHEFPTIDSSIASMDHIKQTIEHSTDQRASSQLVCHYVLYCRIPQSHKCWKFQTYAKVCPLRALRAGRLHMQEGEPKFLGRGIHID